jgi:mannosyltransferase PIG-V
MGRSVGAMAGQATSARPRRRALEAPSLAVREALRAFFVSRVLVWVSATLAIWFVPFDAPQRSAHDVQSLTHPLGATLGALARWDATWYLSIAQQGYGQGGGHAAFFPLYPLAVRAAAFGSASGGPLLLASYAVSAAALLVALVLLERLVELELGARFARPVLMLVALWPASFFFSAPYSESLFLALSVGMFYAARSERWSLAASLCALATAARPTGVLLLVPFAWMAWRAGRLRWLALAPLGAAAFSAWLGLAGQRPFGWAGIERDWGHEFKGPLGGVHDAVVAGVKGFGQLFASHTANRVVAGENALYLVLLVLAVIALVGVLRRLPLAYGLYLLVSLLVIVSAPVAWQPLMSFGRLLSVLFPVAMWVALVLDGRRFALGVLLGASSALLVLGTALFATWHLVT